ncbi:MAG: FkbM family methyltransferase [Anderseniella sp.]
MSVLDHARFISSLKDRGFDFSVFYDVGANIGTWSINVQDRFPDAHFELFEPLAGHLADVDDRSLVPKLHSANLHSVALSDETRDGEIKILGRAGVGSSILVLSGDRKKDIKIIPCKMVRMDEYVAREQLKQPDFIKLDTQAAELKVLQGAEQTIRGTKFILLETWMRRVYGPDTPLFHEIADWLYAHDFVLYEMLIPEDGRDADGTLRWFDAVFINKLASSFPPAML